MTRIQRIKIARGIILFGLMIKLTIAEISIEEILATDTIFVKYKMIKKQIIGKKNCQKYCPFINIAIPSMKPYVVATALPP